MAEWFDLLITLYSKECIGKISNLVLSKPGGETTMDQTIKQEVKDQFARLIWKQMS